MTSPHDAMAAELRRVTEERDKLRVERDEHGEPIALKARVRRELEAAGLLRNTKHDAAPDADAGREETRDMTDKATAWDAVAEKNAQLAAVRAEIPAELLLAHKGDMAAAVRAMVGRIGRALEHVEDACSHVSHDHNAYGALKQARAELRGGTDA